MERVHRGQHCVCVEPMCMEHVRVVGNTHSTYRSTDDSNSWLHTWSSTHIESKPRWVMSHGQKWILKTSGKSGETVHDIKLGTDTLETKAQTLRETIGVISISNYTEVRHTCQGNQTVTRVTACLEHTQSPRAWDTESKLKRHKLLRKNTVEINLRWTPDLNSNCKENTKKWPVNV